MTLLQFRDLLARLQLEVASLPDDHLPETLRKGLLKLTRWIHIPHCSSPKLFTFPRAKFTFQRKIPLSLFKGIYHFHFSKRENVTFTFSGIMRRLTSLEPEHVTAAKKYICDGRNVFMTKEIHL